MGVDSWVCDARGSRRLVNSEINVDRVTELCRVYVNEPVKPSSRSVRIDKTLAIHSARSTVAFSSEDLRARMSFMSGWT